jgi:hypothetical protein
MTSTSYEIRDVTPGRWLWRTEHPDWSPEAEWERALVFADALTAPGSELRV